MFVPLGHLASYGALPLESCECVQMADGNGEGVGGVEWFRGLSKFEQTRHHMLDLLLLRASVADYRGLDRERRVFGDFESGGSSGQHGHASYLPQFQC